MIFTCASFDTHGAVWISPVIPHKIATRPNRICRCSCHCCSESLISVLALQLHFFLCFVNTKIDSLNTLLCITLGRWITPVTSININTFLLSLHAPVRRLLSQRSFSNTLWKWHTRPELLACRINSEWPSLHLPLCVCVTFHRGHGIRWWVPGNPIYLQAESRNIWMHSCQRHRHRCPDCRHHRQLWVHCLRLKKTQKTINK